MSHKQLAPVLLSLNQEQRNIIATQLADVASKLLRIQFNDPAKDEQLIRMHAALTGQKEAYEFLLYFDEQQTEKFNQDNQDI